jgi:hypothetical protein
MEHKVSPSDRGKTVDCEILLAKSTSKVQSVLVKL